MIKTIGKAIFVGVLSLGCTIPQVYAEPASDSAITEILMQMESPAEDMLDAIDHKDTHKLNGLYHELEASMARLNKISNTAHIEGDQRRAFGLQNSWFDLISLELNEMDDLPALANAINQFSGQLIVTTHFKHEYRKSIAWMDYLGRELLLLNKYPSDSPNHGALLKTRKTEMQATWHVVKTAIGKGADGMALIHKVDPVIHALVTESSPARLVALSEKELDLVDDIEAWFHID